MSRIYTTANPMPHDVIARIAPSVFQTQAHESRSARYTYVPTVAILEGLEKEGFVPVFARQGKSRIEGKADFTRHMLRFRHAGSAGALVLNQTFPEVVLTNSHDGTSCYEISAGLFRLVCLNGMVVAEARGEAVKFPHKGDIMGPLIEGSYRVLQDSTKALERSAEWRGIDLSRDERLIMAEAAHVVRFGDAEGNTDTPIKPEQLLQSRRFEDRANDLWTTGNVLQENVIRGGLSARRDNTRDERGGFQRGRRTTTRPVTGISEDVRLNKALWLLGERMAALKGGVAMAA